MAGQSGAALGALRPLPPRHGIGLLAGTMPVAKGNGPDGAPPQVNRAQLMLPDGRVFERDKPCLTPSEKNPRGWNPATGDRVTAVQREGLRVATLVCLDIELPGLAARLVPLKPDLAPVPSATETVAGYKRVFSCARAEVRPGVRDASGVQIVEARARAKTFRARCSLRR